MERMLDYLIFLCRADFMQMMLASTLVFLLPLNKRRHWGRRMLAVSIPALTLNVWLTGLIISGGWNSVISTPYDFAPLAASLLCFLLCADAPGQDAVYGLGCAYAIQHMAFCTSTILLGERWIAEVRPPSYTALSWLIQLAVLGLCILPARKLPRNGAYGVSWQEALLYTGMVVFIAMILNRVIRSVWQTADPASYAICLAYDLFCCLFILLLQLAHRRELTLQAAVEGERALRRRAQEQYAASRENIDIINRKCHDLKHQVSALRLVRSPEEREDSLREIERQVMIYDTEADTGNEVLNTVLTEKGLVCERSGISWSCMADGAVLDFIAPVDLYILLGNALDNAIESSRAIPSPERRVVRVSVRREHGAAFIQVENYFDHSLRESGGGLATTKADAANHGFGLRSIRSVTEQYGGTLDIETENGKFLLSILIPLPFRR